MARLPTFLLVLMFEITMSVVCCLATNYPFASNPKKRLITTASRYCCAHNFDFIVTIVLYHLSVVKTVTLLRITTSCQLFVSKPENWRMQANPILQKDARQ
jgi:hypothetical protein